MARASMWLGIVVWAVFASGPADAAALGLGSKVEPFTLADQNGATHRIDENTDVIIFTPDSTASDVIHQALSNNGKKLLETHHAVCVADISGMPGFVRNLVMLPKLKERPYPMLVDTSGELSRTLPSKNAAATLIFLDNLQIMAVEYVTNPATVVPALSAPKRFAAH